jgi:hypothetical protein
MANPASVATVTADIGAGLAVSSSALTGVTKVTYDFVAQTATFECRQGKPCYDIKDQTTITITVSGVTYTLVIS